MSRPEDILVCEDGDYVSEYHGEDEQNEQTNDRGDMERMGVAVFGPSFAVDELKESLAALSPASESVHQHVVSASQEFHQTQFSRFGVYFVPKDSELAEFGARWLGWDINRAEPVVCLAEDAITETPRRYGFHATLKPPFRLAQGTTLDEFRDALRAVSLSLPSIVCEDLALERIGSFLALTTTCAATSDLAAVCVKRLDGFRAPASDEEQARRLKKSLSARQEELLVQFGYPYVMEEFRFHLTLTGSMRDSLLTETEATLTTLLAPFLGSLVIDSVALVGERIQDGCFQVIEHFPLTG